MYSVESSVENICSVQAVQCKSTNSGGFFRSPRGAWGCWPCPPRRYSSLQCDQPVGDAVLTGQESFTFHLFFLPWLPQHEQPSERCSWRWRWFLFRQFLVNLWTGLTRVLEGLERKQKKGKSSEFDARNHGQVKFSLAPKVWSHEGSNLHQKYCQNFIMLLGVRPAKTCLGNDSGVVRSA